MDAILAVNNTSSIGLENRLPWKCKADLAHFKKLTMNKKLLVGRVTYENMPKLEGREMIVVGTGYRTLEEGLALKPDFVIGGAKLLDSILHKCDTVHLSIINDFTEGDTKFVVPSYYNVKRYYFETDETITDWITMAIYCGETGQSVSNLKYKLRKTKTPLHFKMNLGNGSGKEKMYSRAQLDKLSEGVRGYKKGLDYSKKHLRKVPLVKQVGRKYSMIFIISVLRQNPSEFQLWNRQLDKWSQGDWEHFETLVEKFNQNKDKQSNEK